MKNLLYLVQKIKYHFHDYTFLIFDLLAADNRFLRIRQPVGSPRGTFALLWPVRFAGFANQPQPGIPARQDSALIH
jgi:hypothetical protein